MAIIGIDFGLRRIGLAISDDCNLIALPLGVADARKSVKAEITTLLGSRTIERAVIGLPLDRDGNITEIGIKARKFAQNIERWFAVPVELWDERYTSAQAATINIRKSGSHDKKALNDITSAIIILQSYLEYHNHHTPTNP